MISEPKLRFIPFRKQDVLAMCLAKAAWPEDTQNKFQQLARLLGASVHFEFHSRLERLKDAYSVVNPDRDTKILAEFAPDGGALSQQLDELLNKANYEKFSDSELARALNENSLFDLKLNIDFDEFAELAIYTRGAARKRERVTKLLGLWKQEIEFLNYERVVIFSRFKDDYQSKHRGKDQGGAVLLKLFQNVPRADIEMLFPNTRLGMRLIDKLMIAVPAVIGAGLLLKTKAGNTLIQLMTEPGIWLGLGEASLEMDMGALVAVGAALGALGSFIWKQFTNFKHRKLQFMQTLSDNLYFKNLDNNAGVFHKLVDEAEEEENKEMLLAYFFLLTRPEVNTAASLDQCIEGFLEEQYQAKVDFEIDDAIAKLLRLGLIEMSAEQTLMAIPIDAALVKLDHAWDNFFNYSK